jgi:protein SCO1
MIAKRLMLQGLSATALAAALSPAGATRQAAGGPRADYFPNALVENQDGKRMRFYDDVVRGRRVAFNMMYTACSGICPGNTANLLRVQEMLGARLGTEVFMVSLTLQPEFDRPAALKEYVKRYGIKPGWSFLTGDPKEMDLIRRRLGFYDTDPVVDSDIGQHTGMVRIGNETLDRWCMVPALASPKQIARAMLET